MLFRKSGKSEQQIKVPQAKPAAPAPPPPAPAAADPSSVYRTSLGPDASVTGKLSFTVPTRLDGKLKGEVRASDKLLIGRQAFVDGDVRATELIVEGEVRGDVYVDRSVEVAASGRILGRVEAGCLLIEPGGLVNGDCRIIPPPPIVAPPTASETQQAEAK